MALSLKERSQKAIHLWLKEITQAKKYQVFYAVFGTTSYCQEVMGQLHALGFKNGVYVASNPSITFIGTVPVKSLAELKESSVNFVILGSLANAQFQADLLLKHSIEAPVFSIPNSECLALEYDVTPSEKVSFDSLENKHINESAFIVGNGPSLNQTDPRRIKNAVVMGCNGICQLEGFDPDYYFMVDRNAPLYWQREIDRLKGMKIVPNHLKSCQFDHSNTVFYPRSYRLCQHSIDPYQYGLPKGLSVISPMVYMAVYMGVKRIYFIGVDQDYGKKQSEMHFMKGYYPDKKSHLTQSFLQERIQRQNHGISLALEAAKAGGVECYDAGPLWGMGIDSVDFESLSQFLK
ncbi:6-hydroxymethylpterin diphosphokinase MptE-like protein [Hydrogenovibrio halophilus]|uniref:6-hydroxymethylpterin diphosphokinase MptE-like protein n=1 Tax=Hydrogenovibrio halophilus TaxID=373391 RepID=UPI000362973F|nr:6-hydroxymethylpterin diphosphokinase MptE-like protein [Hydrogenovibrio halophilus]